MSMNCKSCGTLLFHSDEVCPNCSKRLKPAGRLGATGKFPDGKMDPTDEGELQFAVCVKDGKVIFEFGKPVAWVGFTPEQARGIAASIKAAADHIQKPSTIIVVPS